MSSELSDKLIPIIGEVGLIDSTNEVGEKIVDGKDVNGKLICLALSSCMSDAHVGFNS